MKNSKSVFLVEDDEDDQKFFMEALNEMSNLKLYAIAKNGREAIQILENSQSQPDIIFMDINMPLMNGIECLAEMKKRETMKNIPVVILSTDTGRFEKIKQLGGNGFIKKPHDKTRLRIEIEKMVQIILSSRIKIKKPERVPYSFIVDFQYNLNQLKNLNF
jgi:CheY-like chemotaxis protein